MTKRKKIQFGDCALCLKHGKLAKSHIVSRFHTTYLYRGGRDIVSVSETGFLKNKRGGHWERLLCHYCDNSLGKQCEDKVAKLFYHGRPKINELAPAGIIFDGVEFEPLRLYCLSTLWKMSVSTLPYFSHVSVGSETEEQLRTGVLERNLMENFFPVTIAQLVSRDNKPFSASIKPFTVGNKAMRSVVLITNGIMHNFHLEGYEENQAILNLVPNRSGQLGIPKIEFEEIGWLYDRFTRTFKHS